MIECILASYRQQRSKYGALLFGVVLIGAPSTVPAGASSSAQEPADPSDNAPDIVARVNGEALYTQDVEGVLGEIHRGLEERERSSFDLDEMLFRLVNDTLLAQEARTLGMADDPALVRKLESMRERMARQRIEREEIFERLELSEEELTSVYKDVYRRATIKVLTRRDKQEAEAIKRQIESGADFEELVAKESQDPYRMRQGLINDLPAIDLPGELREVVFELQPGDLGGPAATGYGWTLFKVVDLKPADPEQYEARKGHVRNFLRFNKEEALRSELLATLRKTYPVELNEPVYDAIAVKTMPDGRLLPEIADPEAVVATAGKHSIAAAEFGKALASRWSNIANEEIATAIKPILLDRLLVDEMLALEAESRGYEEAPEVERAVHALETQLLVKQYLKEIVQPRVEVSTEDLEAYYEAHRDRFRRPPLLHVSQLTVGTEEEAERLAKMIREGADFAWLARQYSTDGYRDSGGVIGWVPANRGVTGFTSELLDAEAGDLFGPVDFHGDWRLLRVDLLEPQEHYSFEEVSGNVRKQVEQLEFLEVLDDLIQELRARSDIWINDKAVAAMEIQANPESEDSPPAPGHG